MTTTLKYNKKEHNYWGLAFDETEAPIIRTNEEGELTISVIKAPDKKELAKLVEAAKAETAYAEHKATREAAEKAELIASL